MGGVGGAAEDASTPAAQAPGTPSADNGNGESGPASYYGVEQRVVVRNARMTVEVDDYETAFQRARRAVREAGGFVADQQRTREGDWVRGRFVMKVPATRFNEIRDTLAELGTVETSTYRAEDFTKRYATRQSRIEQLRERETGLEARKANASGYEADEIEEELRTVRRKIREATAEQAALERRAAFSTIVVNFHEPEGAKPPKNHETAFGFDDAILEGLYGGLAVLKGAIVAVAFLVPVFVTLVVLLVGALGAVALLLAVRRHVTPRIWALFALDNRLQVEEEPGEG